MVKADQFPGGVAAPVQQGGDQPVAVPDPGPVRAVNIEVRFDDPHLQPVHPGQARPVGQDLTDFGFAAGASADPEVRPGRRDRGEHGRPVLGTLSQHPHARTGPYAGRGTPRPPSPAVTLSQTFRYPIPGNSVIATTKYIPTREGSARIRFCTAPVISSTSSPSSNGR